MKGKKSKISPPQSASEIIEKIDFPFEGVSRSTPRKVIPETVFLPAVRDYLKLKGADKIARLAAAMAPRPMEFDAEALIDAAIALQAKAEAKLTSHREKILQQMNNPTLLRLAQEFGISDSHKENEVNGMMFLDPVVGPVLQILRLRADAPPRQYLHMSRAEKRAAELESQKYLEDAFLKADKRTKLERPILPCSLEEALRYTADAPNAPWKAIQIAFKNWLMVSNSSTELKTVEHNVFCKMNSLQSMHDRIEHEPLSPSQCADLEAKCCAPS